ncbi:MAG: biotin--[acetyl-CoA-carboxylase] ligase [Actinobacteria bacterium]|nr:biotin--[acetyl-CoA-carboxylase] ligase [Actinomycetota bacterium]
MLSQDSLERVAQTLAIDAPLLWRDQTGSTNTDAILLAERGAPELTTIVAGHQIAGRGRLGRTWEAAPGSSLLISVILRPSLPAEELPLVSLMAALELSDSLRAVLGLPIAVKWPNDLMVHGRKIAGVLPEAKLAAGRALYVVVGAGVNLRQRPDDFAPGIREVATSAAIEGADVDEAREAEIVLYYLAGLRRYRPGEPGWGETVIGSARATCETLGRAVRASTVDGRTVEGYAADLDRHGGLVIVSGGRRETVAFGEVHHLR